MTRHFMYQAPGRPDEVHGYTKGEVEEVFGKNAAILDQHGHFFASDGGLWIDMDYAAREHARKARAENERAPDEAFPVSIKYHGRTFVRSGKHGTRIETGELAMEYQHRDVGIDERVWRTRTGTVYED